MRLGVGLDHDRTLRILAVEAFDVRADRTGFDLAAILDSAGKGTYIGLGLSGMEERIALLDGNLNVWSEPGKGTRIKVYVPTLT